MRREQLEHVLRATSQIANDPEILIIGSQSILGAIPEEQLPSAATASIEVDAESVDVADAVRRRIRDWIVSLRG